jgi:chloramphenicol-sensitive protein RarD
MNNQSTKPHEQLFNERQTFREGLFYALFTYLSYGFLPLFWKQLAAVSPVVIVAHRVIWSVIFLALVLVLTRRFNQVSIAFKTCGFYLLITGLLIGFNWGIYIWAINNGFVLEASLGYFIFPVVSAFCGAVFLKEQLTPRKWFAIFIAAFSVCSFAIFKHTAPWIALSLAFSFAFYAVIRKSLAAVPPQIGLFIESVVLLPLAFLILYSYPIAPSFFSYAFHDKLFLAFTGLVTVLPLLSWSAAVSRLGLSTAGMIQYLSPSIQFLLSIYAFNEPYSSAQIWMFAGIWLSVVVYIFRS